MKESRSFQCGILRRDMIKGTASAGLLSKMVIASMNGFFSLLTVFYFAVVMPLQAAEKRLPLKGEVFTVQERTAFLFLPEEAKAGQLIPWVWYARAAG